MLFVRKMHCKKSVKNNMEVGKQRSLFFVFDGSQSFNCITKLTLTYNLYYMSLVIFVFNHFVNLVIF